MFQGDWGELGFGGAIAPVGTELCWGERIVVGIAMETLTRITINPDICLGQPTIRGMRITVSFVLKLLASNLSVPQVLASYPELKLEDIQEAPRYAA